MGSCGKCDDVSMCPPQRSADSSVILLGLSSLLLCVVVQVVQKKNFEIDTRGQSIQTEMHL